MGKFKSFLRFLNSSLIDRYGYHAGLAAFFLPVAVLLVAHLFSLKPPILLIFILQAVGVLMLGGVATIKTVRALLKNRKSRFLKWGLGITKTLFVGALSLVLTKEVINAATGTDPAHFSVSMKVFPVLLSPAVWVGLIGGCALVYALALIMKLNALAIAGTFTGGAIEPPPFLPSLGKVFGSASIFFAAAVFLIMLSSQVRMLNALLVRFDYVSKSECPSVRPGELIKDLHNGRVSVAVPRHDGSYAFEIRACEVNDRRSVSGD